MIKNAFLSIAAALLTAGLLTGPAAAGPILPDLVITNISISPASPLSGQAVTFTATVKNQGTAATPSGVSIGVNFFIDGQPKSTSDNNIISLAQGASVNLTANLGPGGGSGSPTWTASAGSHTVLAQVDPLGRITESSKSNNSLSNTITITAAPPAFVIGDRVQTTANLNVYATASTSGTILGQHAVGSLGTVIGGPATVNGVVWWNIDYDIGADGWDVQDYLAKASPLPTVSLTANPTSITSGGSSTLTWSSTNATSCTVTGFTAGGTSGTVTVSPTVSQSYSVTCTGAGGTASQSTTITVTAPPPNLPDLIVTNISTSPANPTSGQVVTFTATIINQGIAATPSGVSIGVNFMVDGNPGSTSDNNIISLAPGASVNLTANLGAGGGSGPSTWLASVGSHTVLAQVDPLGRITESSKANNSLSITITVAAAPPAFVIGDRVQTTANLNVYATASTSGTILGQQQLGNLGTVVGGPTTVNGVVWWNIDYDIGADGWDHPRLPGPGGSPPHRLPYRKPNLNNLRRLLNSYMEQHQRHIMYSHRLHRRRDVRYCDRLSDCLTILLRHLHRRGWNGGHVDNYYSDCTAT